MKQKAFISYAIQDSEQYVLTLLSNLLRKEGFSIVSSYDEYSSNISSLIQSNILSSSLFIGIITKYGNRNRNVYNEWKFALNNNIPNILLIEDTVNNINSHLFKNPNVLIFNRNYPNKNIDIIKNRIKKSKNKNDNSIGWILGGLAAIAIIKLLSDD